MGGSICMLTFLHLSDLHITTTDAGTQFDRDTKIRDALIADLGKEGRTAFDAILVTGDIAYHGRAEEFARAKIWLEDVRTTIGSSPEALFVVPGNHDVNQAVVPRDSSLWELHQSLRKPMSPEDKLASFEKKLHDPFDFLSALIEYRAFASEYGCSTTPKELAWFQVLDDGHRLEDGTSVRFHGLNSAVISDQEDVKANLLLGEAQFHHFDAKPSYVNVVLCHHPHSWLMDGNKANDFLRTQAHVVLSGHEHDHRCYREGGSLRVFAGAVHPNRRETRWEPCYHVLRLSVTLTPRRELIASVETRIWLDNERCFGPHMLPNGPSRHEERIGLPPWTRPAASPATISHSPPSNCGLSSSSHGRVMTAILTNDAFAAARRKLIVHFFRLGTLSRYQAVLDAGVWDESDDALDGQARWARVFERAEKADKLAALWTAVAAKDETLAGQTNPFTT
jgi:predicted phosphodiesterase